MSRPSPAPTSASAVLPASTRLGPVELTVTDLDRTICFYRDAIGLRLHRRDDGRAVLGVDAEDLIALVESPSAARAGRHAGLYHVALLLPSRLELAHAAVRLGVGRTPIQGASDHGTHEAIYLGDPDGNGLELAADRPREQWPDLRDPTLWRGGPQPLDLDGLLGLVSGRASQPEAGAGTTVGHVHLHVADVEAALRFYCDVIGFEPQTVMPTAGFVSAGGYHHHVAFNTWRGEGVDPAPEDAVGLRHFTVVVPTAADVAAVRGRLERAGLAHDARDGEVVSHDPSGNSLRIAIDPTVL